MKRVLLVDDDPIVVRIYHAGLTRQGFEVSTAADGVAALKALKASKPDVVVLDLMMPRLSGVEVLKFMRADPAFKALPVIVLSNAYMDPLARGAAELDAQKGLLKIKCNPASLGASIRELLQGQPGAESLDHLLAASKGPVPKPPEPAATVPPPPPPAPRPAPTALPSSAEPAQPGVDLDQARQELKNNAPAIAASLEVLLDTFKVSRTEQDRELRLEGIYRKVHFVTAMAGMAQWHGLAQMASCFEAFLFGIMDRLEKSPNLEASVERTMEMGIGYLRDLLTSPSQSSPGTKQNLRALVVDDDRLSNRLVISALRNAQIQARGTDVPETALSMLKEKRYDLVLLDVEMPGMDGIELCKQLRAIPGYETTPVIYVTLHSDFETRSKTLLSGGTDLIAKPILPTELAVKVVMHWLKSQAAAQPPSS